MGDNNNNFFIKNLGAIIGIIIGAILACTNLYRILLFITAVYIGARIGAHVQYNKEELKEKSKNFIDKL